MARFTTSSIATGDALVRPRTGGARSYFVANFMQFINKTMTARRKRFSYPPCPVPHRGEGFDQEKSAPAWRRSIEQQFHCKPNEAVGPAHVNVVRTDITRMRTDLQHIAKHAVEQQRTLAAATNGPLRSWKRAQIDEVLASRSPKINGRSGKKLAAGGILIAILVGVPFGSSNRSSPPSSNSNLSGRPRSMQMTSDIARGESNYSPAERDVSVMPPHDVVTATIQSPPSGSSPILGARNSPIPNPSK